MVSKSIDEIISELKTIVDRCIKSESCVGYFAMLYLKVTKRVRDEIQKKSFTDCLRMEKLDVIFAQRFITAFNDWQASKATSASWKIAFESAEKSQTIILQHLLLGMNAHINLDLGIAAAETMHGNNIDEVREDFNTINSILYSMITQVENDMIKISPAISILNLHKKSYDEMLLQFSIQTARDGAWKFAKELSVKNGSSYQQAISLRDKKIHDLGFCIANPGRWLRMSLKIIRILEWRSPSSNIKMMQGM
ncbi:MAG: DUF5995 family protein [Daejeonella sp.]